MESNHWNDALKGLESYSETPPAFVKEKIDKAIAIKSSRKMYITFLSLLVVVLLIDGYSSFLGTSNAKQTVSGLNSVQTETKTNKKTAVRNNTILAVQYNSIQGISDNSHVVSINKNSIKHSGTALENTDEKNTGMQPKTMSHGKRMEPKLSAKSSDFMSTGRNENVEKYVGDNTESAIAKVSSKNLLPNNLENQDGVKDLAVTKSNDVNSRKEDPTNVGDNKSPKSDTVIIDQPKDEVKIIPLIVPKVKTKKNEITLIGGPLFALSKTRFSDPELSMKTQKAAFMDLSFSRAVTAKLKFQVGFGFQKWNEKVSQDHFTSITTITPASLDYVYGLDSSGGGPGVWGIIDSIVTPASSVTVDSHTLNQSETTIKRMSLRTALSYDFSLIGNWSYTLNVGHLLNLNSMRVLSANVTTVASSYTKFSGTLFLDNSINYKINDIVFRAGLHTGFDYKPSLNWNSLANKRTYISPFFGVSYNF